MTTPSHVLVLKVGPVQGFIRQSRRTRDLWFGSELLSRVSRDIAISLKGQGAELVFPHPDQLAAPNPSTGNTRVKADASTKGVPNKVLALVTGDPEVLARSAREAALGSLRKAWEPVLARCEDLLAEGAQTWAHEQLDSFLEFHAAWVPVDVLGYEKALEEAEAALEARRALREFKPWTVQAPAGTHKSSLDGARPSVLKPKRTMSGEWKRLRIGEREELDALGLLKRAGGEPEQFVPIPSIGLAAWLDTARRKHPAKLEALREACVRRKFPRIDRVELPWVESFPFDGQLLLPERRVPYFEEFQNPGTARPDAARFGTDVVEPLHKAVGVDPYPYVACLVADGDKMGAALRKLAGSGGWEAHRKVAHALARFTEDARNIVQVKHRGMLVYAGGDDVLAFVCPSDAPACALALSREFQRHLSHALEGTDVKTPTLSVGLGIGHVMESLSQLLSLGRRAEEAAKHAGRDALAILVAMHAGRERLWTSPWMAREGSLEPLARLKEDMELLSSGRLPLSKVHEVEAMARRFPPDDHGRSSADQASVLRAEAERILARSDLGRRPNPPSMKDVGLGDLETAADEEVHTRLSQWGDRMLVAETLERAGRVETLKKEGER